MTFQLSYFSPSRWLALGLAAIFAACGTTSSDAATVRLTVENIGPAGSTYITPVFAGFHDGSFDLSNGGTATAGLELLAELGDTGFDFGGAHTGLTAEFLGGAANRVTGTLGGGPLAPGASATQDFVVDLTGDNTRLTLASMLLPSSDYFFGNIAVAPLGFDLSGLSSTPTTFVLANVYDAGTELNDFATSAPPDGAGLFPGQPATNPPLSAAELLDPVTGLPPGITLVTPGTEFDDFLNTGTFIPPTISQLRITATIVPEPSMGFAACLVMGGVAARRRRRR